jgi:hypothetical protein
MLDVHSAYYSKPRASQSNKLATMTRAAAQRGSSRRIISPVRKGQRSLVRRVGQRRRCRLVDLSDEDGDAAGSEVRHVRCQCLPLG